MSTGGFTRDRARPAVLAAIAAGGALGTLGRYGLTRAVPAAPGSFPWATFAANLAGAFLLGMFVTVAVERLPPSRYLRPFVAIGVLGSFTTYSALAVDTVTFAKDGDVALGAAYLAVTLTAGLLSCAFGVVVARVLPGGTGTAP